MSIPRLTAAAAVAVLLAGCGGGGSGTSPSGPAPALPALSNSSTQKVTTGIAVRITANTQKSAANGRRPQQVTSGTTALDVNIDGTDNQILLSSCTGTAPNYTCLVPATAGSHQVYVETEDGTSPPYTPVGYSVPQSVSVSVGQTTSVTFTLTPTVHSFSGSGAPASLPEDQSTHSVTGLTCGCARSEWGGLSARRSIPSTSSARSW